MSIILFCEQGHDLGTRDPFRRGHSVSSRIVEVERQAYQDQLPRQPFCTKCGKPTLDKCKECDAKIAKGPRPSYCGACGKPFPWTESALTAAREYTDELDGLSSEDKETLKSTFDDLSADTPRTHLAAYQFKKLIKKITPAAGDVLQKIIVDVLSETGKKLLSGM